MLHRKFCVGGQTRPSHGGRQTTGTSNSLELHCLGNIHGSLYKRLMKTLWSLMTHNEGSDMGFGEKSFIYSQSSLENIHYIHCLFIQKHFGGITQLIQFVQAVWSWQGYKTDNWYIFLFVSLLWYTIKHNYQSIIIILPKMVTQSSSGYNARNMFLYMCPCNNILSNLLYQCIKMQLTAMFDFNMAVQLRHSRGFSAEHYIV